MTVVLVILAGVLVVGLAAYVVARASARLSHTRSRTVYDLAEAVEFVADRLPDELAAKLSHADVELVLQWRLDHLRLRGSATYGRADTVASEAEPEAEGTDEPVVTTDDEAVDYVLSQAIESDQDIDALDVVVVLDLESQYLDVIGALGPPVDDQASGEL